MAVNTTWVFVEEQDGKPAAISLELLTKARTFGGELSAILLGAGSEDLFAELDPLALCHMHGRPQPDVVITHQRYGRDFGALIDDRFRSPGDRQVEPFFDFYQHL